MPINNETLENYIDGGFDLGGGGGVVTPFEDLTSDEKETVLNVVNNTNAVSVDSANSIAYGVVFVMEFGSSQLVAYNLRRGDGFFYVEARNKKFIPLFTASRSAMNFDCLPQIMRVAFEQVRLSGGGLLPGALFLETNTKLYTEGSVVRPVWNFGFFESIVNAVSETKPLPVEIKQNSIFATKWSGIISATGLIFEPHYGFSNYGYILFSSIKFEYSNGTIYSKNWAEISFPGWLPLTTSTNGTAGMRTVDTPAMTNKKVIYFGFNKILKVFEAMTPVKNVGGVAVVETQASIDLLISGDFVPFIRYYCGVWELVSAFVNWSPEVVGSVIPLPQNY